MAVLTLALISWFVMRLAVNPVLDWAVVGEYLFSPQILSGVRNTIVVTLLAEVIGIVAGLFLAIARISPNPVIQTLSWFYIWFFRGIPVLVQLIFWFNLGLVFQTLSLSIPFTDVVLLSADTNQLITPFIAVLLGLGLNEAAYDAEIIRGGILSVSRGQTEAAASLGLSSTKTMRFVILPQALRVIIPPISNQLIIMLKISSLASVVTYRELTTTAQNIYSVNLRSI
jgi:polar amino acid transport system permease protein